MTSAAAHGDRAGRLEAALAAHEVDALLVTALPNVRWLTGYTGSNGLAVLGRGRRAFVTDFRYVEQAAVEVAGEFERLRSTVELFDAIEGSLPRGVGSIRLGFEANNVTVSQRRRLEELLGERVTLVETLSAVEALRAVKDEGEIAAIRAASELADAALRAVLERGIVGRTEREVALDLEVEMRQMGAQRASFEPIVAAGAHGALPHAQPREKAIGAGELVVIDWGAELDGYCSDCTRTVMTGEPSAAQSAAYALVLAAQKTGLEAVRAGARGAEVDALARRVIEEGGHGEHYGHGLGHGVGLLVHEAPRLGQRSEDVLAVGNVVTVEPGVYVPGSLGVRIEDLVVVGKRGAEILTSLPKDLTVVD